jgi:hypothetical protein
LKFNFDNCWAFRHLPGGTVFTTRSFSYLCLHAITGKPPRPSRKQFTAAPPKQFTAARLFQAYVKTADFRGLFSRSTSKPLLSSVKQSLAALAA